MNKTSLVDFGNSLIKVNQSLNPPSDTNDLKNLEKLKKDYEQSGSDKDLYKYLHSRKKNYLNSGKNNDEFETNIKMEANDIFDNMAKPYMEYIKRANERFINIKNSYDISNRLKSNTDEFVMDYEDIEINAKKDLDDLKRKKSVNIRMADYYNKNYEIATYILQILEKIYYYTIIVLIIITIIKGQYKNMMIVGRLIFMIVLPFIVKLILQGTYER